MTEQTPPDTRPSFESWLRELSTTVKIRKIETAFGRSRAISAAFRNGKGYRPVPVKWRTHIIVTIIDALGAIKINGRIITKVGSEYVMIYITDPYNQFGCATVTNTSEILNLFAA